MFYELLELGPDALVVSDARGVILAVNHFAEAMFGYTRDELIGRPSEILVPARRRDLHRSQIADLADAKRSVMALGAAEHLVASRKDGSEFEIEVALSSLETPDGTLVAAAVRDITERRAVQAERDRLAARADRLEHELSASRLETLGHLAGRVAHDFNNLLGAILNYTHFVAEEIDRAASGDTDRSWATVRDDVAQIHLATTRAASLSQQLHAFSRRDVSRPQRLDINETLSAMGDAVRACAGD